MILKQSTAAKIPFFMRDSSDSITGLTGLTPAVTLSKDGAGFGSPVGAVTEIGNGWYYLLADVSGANDVGTLGSLILHATGTGADAWDESHQVCVELPGVVSDKTGYSLSTGGVQAIWDALTSALTTSGSVGKLLVDKLDATISSRSTLTAANVWDALLSGITTSSSIGKLIKDNLDAAITSRLASSDYVAPDNDTITDISTAVDGLPTIGEISQQVWDEDLSGHGPGTAGADVTDIKAKTANLPADPAGVSDVTDARDAIQSDIAAIVTIHGQPIRNSAFRMTFRMYTSAGVPATSLIDLVVKFSTDGTGLVQTDNDPVELTDGWYYIDLIAAEMDGKLIALDYSATGAAPSWDKFTTEDAT